MNNPILKLMESLLPDDARSNLQMARILCSIFDKASPKMQSIMFQVVLGTATGRGIGAESFLVNFVRNWPTEFKAACDALGPELFEGFKAAIDKYVGSKPPCGYEECRDEHHEKRELNVLTVMRVPADEKGN